MVYRWKLRFLKRFSYQTGFDCNNDWANTDADPNSNSNTYTYSDANSDATAWRWWRRRYATYPDADPKADCNANPDPNSNTHADANTDAYTDAHAYTHSDGCADTFTYTHPDGSSADADSYSDTSTGGEGDECRGDYRADYCGDNNRGCGVLVVEEKERNGTEWRPDSLRKSPEEEKMYKKALLYN